MADILDIYNMSGSPGMASVDTSSISARLARVEGIVPYQLRGGKFAAQKFNAFSPIISSGMTNGKLNLGDTAGIDFKGILAPNVIDGQFAVACPSSTTAAIYWDGTNTSRVIVIRRADQTTSTIPGNSLTISGLTQLVKYQAFAFWAPGNACGIGFAPGSTGTPLIAIASTDSDTIASQAQAAASLAGREPLGNISWTQPAAGGSSGGGPPSVPPARQPGTCVMVNTQLKPLGNEAIDTVLHPWTDWVRIETEPGGVFTRGLNCTPNHPLYDSEAGKVDASFFLGKTRWIITENGEEKITNTTQFIRACTKVEARMKTGHIFFANGFMSHNVKIQPDQL